jgi:hypothetical protein
MAGAWGTLRGDGREAAYAEAQRLEGECPVEIEGVLHRRAAAPMWSVDPTGWDRSEVSGATLGLPEFQVRSWSPGLFPLDPLDPAVNVGPGRAGRCRRRPGTVGILRYAAPVQTEEPEGKRGLALFDLKEDVEAAAPATPGAEMPPTRPSE